MTTEKLEELNQILNLRKAGFILKDYKFKFENSVLLYDGKKERHPCISLSEDLLKKGSEEICDYLEDVYKITKTIYPDTIDKDYIHNHVSIQFVDKSVEATFKKDNILSVAYLDVIAVFVLIPESNFNSAMPITIDMLLEAKMNFPEIMARALKNMDEHVKVGVVSEAVYKDGTKMPDMYAITNDTAYMGAASMLCVNALRQIVQRFGDRFLVIPISQHGVIAMSYEECKDNIDLLKNILSFLSLDEKGSFLSNNIYLWNKDHYQIV